jgi:hypothetical protein
MRTGSSVWCLRVRPSLTRRRGSSGLSKKLTPSLGGSAGHFACRPFICRLDSAAGVGDNCLSVARDIRAQSVPGEDPFISTVLTRSVVDDDLYMLAGSQYAVGWSECDRGTIESCLRHGIGPPNQ